MEEYEYEQEYNPIPDKSPCDTPDNDGIHRCPYSNDPTSEMCRNYCGMGVDC